MKYSADILPRIKNFAERYGFLIFSLAFLLLAFRLLPDYGIGFDAPKNFSEGRINLNALLTGQATPRDQISVTYQIHGAFFFMISELSRRLLSDTLGWLDPASAQHAFLPVLVFFFMNLIYAFLRKRADPRTAFLTCALLLTTPHFWGHLFNNIKDIPLFVCFSLSIFSFYEWRASGFLKTRYLYGTLLLIALTLLSKLYALLIPLLLILWIVVPKIFPVPRTDPPPAGTPWNRQNLLHALLGSFLALVLLALFFMPVFFIIGEKMIFLKAKAKIAQKLMDHGTHGWSFFPWVQVFYIMPALTLAAAFGGGIKTLFQKPLSSLSSLMLTWFFVVMCTASSPLFPVYNGIRLFLVFLVPFCFFAVVGVTGAAEFLSKISPLKKNGGVWLLGILLLAFQIAGIVQTHPYETTFFNRLAGGLKGAQEKHIPDAEDYWLTSYRAAVAWVNRNAPKNATLLVPNPDSMLMLDYYSLRKDLRHDFVQGRIFPRNSFLIVVQSNSSWINLRQFKREDIEQEAHRMMNVYEIKRQGAVILTIYYKP